MHVPYVPFKGSVSAILFHLSPSSDCRSKIG